MNYTACPYCIHWTYKCYFGGKKVRNTKNEFRFDSKKTTYLTNRYKKLLASLFDTLNGYHLKNI